MWFLSAVKSHIMTIRANWLATHFPVVSETNILLET